jgi:hypothetical protein
MTAFGWYTCVFIIQTEFIFKAEGTKVGAVAAYINTPLASSILSPHDFTAWIELAKEDRDPSYSWLIWSIYVSHTHTAEFHCCIAETSSYVTASKRTARTLRFVATCGVLVELLLCAMLALASQWIRVKKGWTRRRCAQCTYNLPEKMWIRMRSSNSWIVGRPRV